MPTPSASSNGMMSSRRHSQVRRRFLDDRGWLRCASVCLDALVRAQPSPTRVLGGGWSSANGDAAVFVGCVERRGPDRLPLGMLAWLYRFSWQVTSIRLLSADDLPAALPVPGCWSLALVRCLNICLWFTQISGRSHSSYDVLLV